MGYAVAKNFEELEVYKRAFEISLEVLGYINLEKAALWKEEYVRIGKMINGLYSH